MKSTPPKQTSGMIQSRAEDILPDIEVLLRRSRRYRDGNGQNLVSSVEEALQIAAPLVQPAAVWSLKPIVQASLLEIPGLSPATLAKITLHFGVVCTIGSQLETTTQRLFFEKRYSLGYWVDQIGTYCVSFFTKRVAKQLCQEYGAVRWAPGDQTGEAFCENQQALFDWVPAGKIGVFLTDQMVMYPVKSLSFNLFAGDELDGIDCMVSCNHCVWNGACDR